MVPRSQIHQIHLVARYGDGRGSLFAPSAWLVLGVPVRKQIDLKIYGFYIGEMNVPVAQVDLPIRTAKFLTITPSYMGYRVPASGLNRLTPEPGRFTDSYHEHQFRIDGTVRSPSASWRCPSAKCTSEVPAGWRGDINRFRGRIAIAHPLAVGGRNVKPFASYETFIRARRRVEQGSSVDRASRCSSRSRCSFNPPTCGKPVKAVEISTTCCLV